MSNILPLNDTLTIHQHYNLPQLLVEHINAWFTVIEWARGTGKSTGPVANRTIRCAKLMPRSAGTYSSPSYRKFTDHLWPALRKAYTEKFKLVEGNDFMFLQRPPDNWKLKNGEWAVPYMAPGDFHHFVTFRNGSGYHIISQDHGQTANALDTDWSVVDEAKLQDGERIKAEVWNTLRGNSDYFGHLPEHLSRWVFSDKYVRSNSKQSRWISEFKERASSKKLVEEILVTKIAISDSKNPALIEELNKQLSQLQKQCTFYSEAITLDNVHALGFDYIVNQYKSNTPYEFLTSLWNMDIKKAEGSLFYPLFSEYIQGYDASDNNRIDELIEKNGHDEYLANRSSRLDTDIIKNEPLKLLLDFGGTYNWAVVAQKQYNVVKALKNFWVEKPEKVPHLIEKVCKYYSSHGKKVIELYYDAGANKENAMEVKTDIQRIKNQLNKLGWSVFDKWENRKDYIRHKLKYEFWNYVLDESNKRDDRFPKFRVNRANCHELIWSMSLAKLKRGENQSVTDPYQKDKRNETNPDYPQWQATHLSDCIDWLAVDYLNQLKEKGNRYAVPLLR